MIRFTCRCGHLFEESDDDAGAGVQCPMCLLLNDVPLPGELAAMGGDGTYTVGQRLTVPNPDALPDLIEAFGKNKVDADGNPIDLRNEDGDMLDVGAFETVEQMQHRQRPRYDPETGELLTPIPL